MTSGQWDADLWNDAQMIEKLVGNMGAVVLKPPKTSAGFTSAPPKPITPSPMTKQ